MIAVMSPSRLSSGRYQLLLLQDDQEVHEEGSVSVPLHELVKGWVSSQGCQPINASFSLFQVVKVGMNVSKVVEECHEQQHQVIDVKARPFCLNDRKGHLVQVKSALELSSLSVLDRLQMKGQAHVVKEHGQETVVVL